MPKANSFDVLESQSLALPYITSKRPLDPEPRLVWGHDTLVTPGESLRKRYPVKRLLGSAIASKRIDRVLFYETLDSPRYSYLLFSMRDTTTGYWALYYIDLDAVTPTLTSAGTLRDLSMSTRPHEMAVSRGKVYIKSFPHKNNPEKLGTVVLDGSGGTVNVGAWGIVGPTEPVHMSNQYDPADPLYIAWSPSNNPVTVYIGWKYTYAYEFADGTISNRAPLETNPSLPASNTGAFSNLKPCIQIKGHADTDNVKFMRIYRTMDGGGTFYFLSRIPNNGSNYHFYFDNQNPSGAIGQTTTLSATVPKSDITAGSLTDLYVTADFSPAVAAPFLVKIENEFLHIGAKPTATHWQIYYRAVRGSASAQHNSGTTVTFYGKLGDPIPDSLLDTSEIAPSLTSNSPPPTVVAPKVTGEDTPDASTPIVNFAGRLWYAIGNVLFYSALEELNTGLPEAAWPSGLTGNFFRFAYPVVNLLATGDILFIFTTKTVHWMRGTSKDTFAPNILFPDLGAAPGHPLAVASHSQSIMWLTNDYRIASFKIANLSLEFITDDIGTAIADLHQPAVEWLDAADRTAWGVPYLVNGEVQFAVFGQGQHEWLVVNVTHHGGNTGVDDINTTRQLVYDLRRKLWNTPWSIPATVVYGGPVQATNITPRLLFGYYVVYPVLESSINYMDFSSDSSAQDEQPDGTLVNYQCAFQTSLLTNPPGNHLNALRRPGQVSVLQALKVDLTDYASPYMPSFWVHIDDSSLGANGTLLTNPDAPPRRGQSTGYKSYWYQRNLNTKVERVAIRCLSYPESKGFELQSFGLVFNPEAGA